MTKDDIRKLYLEKRLALPDPEYKRLNDQLCDRFFLAIDLAPVRVLHTFLPIKKYKEPDTWLIINRIKKEFPKMQLAVPKVNDSTGALDNYFFEGPHQLVENKWGISEPKRGESTPTDSIDVVLVPLLAFDQQGFRVGYGKGYYDKFLSSCRADCKKIGISFFPPLASIAALERHDKKLEIVITPEKNFQFQVNT